MPIHHRKARFPEDATTKHTKYTKTSDLFGPVYFVCFVYFVVNLRLDGAAESSQTKPVQSEASRAFLAILA